MSYMSLQSSKTDIIKERAVASGNESAIKAIKMGDTVGIGIDVTNLEALKKSYEWAWLSSYVFLKRNFLSNV
jgi:hypothetical protein